MRPSEKRINEKHILQHLKTSILKDRHNQSYTIYENVEFEYASCKIM
jgi:hypothetical protein